MFSWKTGIVPFCTLLLLAAGCVKQSLDECPAGGYGLVFHYPGNGTTDIFPSKIDHVEMFVYDMDGSQVLDTLLSRQQLLSFQGAQLELASGDYTVVCWGNADGYSHFTDTDPIAEGRLYQSQYMDGGTISDFDSLYFGRRNITIDNRTQALDTVVFSSAHINMEIHIEGYDGVISTRAEGQGIIELTDIPVGYDFAMNLTAERSVIYPVWTSDDEDEMISAKFNLLRFGNDTPIVIHVRDSDGGEVVATVVLADFLAEYGITVEGVNEITVPVYILFDDDGFRVSVEPWSTTPVVPVPRKVND